YAAVIYRLFELYRGKWRFASLPDLSNIFRAVTVLAVSLLVLDYILVAPNFLGTFFFGKLTIILYWFLQMFFLGGPRIAYRYFRYARTRQAAIMAQSIPTLVLGRAADADVLLRAIENGAVKKIWPVGILSPSLAYQRLETVVKGKAVIVTGGGGSIGAEICDRVVTFGAARLLVIENSEPALHAALETLAAKQTGARVEGRLADVRDRTRMLRLM